MGIDAVANRTVDQFVVAAKRARKRGDGKAAIEGYCKALRLVNRYPPAKQDLDAIAKSLFDDAIAVRDSGDSDKAIALLVRSRELNPDSGEVRAELERLLGTLPAERDVTTECFILPDRARAERIYGEAIRTCLEFVAYGGIVGDIFEFGVLGGWTARQFAEAMLTLHYPADLYLFDSFQGLPREKHLVDRASHDVTRGIWDGEMDISRLADEVGEPIDKHIHRRLSRVISPERIKIERGYFSETLQKPIESKAAIVHLDCDLYSSAKEVLESLASQRVFQDGTVLMFDDWNCNRGSPYFGQRRAFREFLETYAGRYVASQFITYGFNSCAFILHDKAQMPETVG